MRGNNDGYFRQILVIFLIEEVTNICLIMVEKDILFVN